MEVAVITLSVCLGLALVCLGTLTPLLLWRVLVLDYKDQALRDEVKQLRVDVDKTDTALAQVLGLIHGERAGTGEGK